MCEGMRKPCRQGRYNHPNLTEACILANRPYSKTITITDALALAHELTELGPKRVIITGIEQGTEVTNACWEEGGAAFTVTTKRLGGQRSGTGDVFSAILIADAVKGVPLKSPSTKLQHS